MLMLVQVFLLTVFLMLIHSVMASFPTRWIARVNSAGSTFNIIALAIVLIIIPAACDRTAFGLSKFNSNKAVWGDIYEGTDFAPGVSVLMSFVSVICKCLHDHQIITNIHLRSMILPGTMSGYDSPFHLAEECSNASIASPRAIFMTSAIGGIVGWLLQLVVAYTVVDITAVLESDLGQPFAAFLNDILPQRIVLAVLSLTIISGFAMGQGCMIAASRIESRKGDSIHITMNLSLLFIHEFRASQSYSEQRNLILISTSSYCGHRGSQVSLFQQAVFPMQVNPGTQTKTT
jgi:amino acid transporter